MAKDIGTMEVKVKIAGVEVDRIQVVGEVLFLSSPDPWADESMEQISDTLCGEGGEVKDIMFLDSAWKLSIDNVDDFVADLSDEACVALMRALHRRKPRQLETKDIPDAVVKAMGDHR